MAPAPPAAISLTSLRRCRSIFPLCLACGAPAFGVMVAPPLIACLFTLPATSAHGWDRPHAIIADKARTGNGLFVAGSGGPILVGAACDPPLDRRADGAAGDPARPPVPARPS